MMQNFGSNSSVIPFPQREVNSNRPTARELLTPQSLEAEQAVLGSCLMERDAIAHAVELLKEEDFYRELHKKIYKVVLKLFDKGDPVDVVTVAEELRRAGQLEECGGGEYLTSLIEACPSSANIDYYARSVQEKSVLRQLILASEQIKGWAYQPESEDIPGLVDKAEKKIFEIGQKQLRDGFVHIKPLLMTAYDQIERQFQHKGDATGVPTGFYDLDNMTSGLQPADLIILAARPSMGKCLSESSRIVDIKTGDLISVEQAILERQERVLNMNESGQIQTARVSDWIDSGVKPTWKVTTRLGRTVEVTGHHPFFTVDGWVPLHDIKVGEKIAVPRSVPAFGFDETLSSECVRWLAYLIAEGTLTSTDIRFTNTDPMLVEDYIGCVHSTFPAFTVRREKNHPTCTMVYKSREGLRDNKPKRWLKEIGLMGKGAREKFIPSCVWTLSRPRLAEFLRVLFSCDGTIYKLNNFPRIEFTVTSKRLAEDVQHALLRFGIVAKMWAKTAKCKEKSFASWRVEITEPSSVLLFNSQIGWIGEKAGRAVSTDFFERTLPKRASNAGHPPKEVWKHIEFACKREGISLVELARRAGETQAQGRFGGFNPHKNRSLPASRLRAYAEVLQDVRLFRIASPDLYWDEITSIEYVGEQQVYDLTVPDGSNFVAQDIFVHNTALALNIAHHIALKERQPVAIFSLEMSKEQLVQRLVCSQAEIKSQDLRRGRVQDADWHRITNAVNELYQANIFIDDSPNASTFEMRAKARRLTAEHGNLGLIVIDYLQLAHSSGRAENRVNEISEIARAFKSMARELKCPIIALSQLSRAVEQREDKRPMLSDLRESGCLTGESEVFLPDLGVTKRMDELEHLSGFRVMAVNDLTGKLEPRIVTRSFSTGIKPVWKLTLASGRTIRATGNHKFLSVKGWERLDELNSGEHLALPRHLRAVNACAATMSDAELALLAHLIGDGSTLEKRGSHYTSGEEELARAVEGFAREVFGDTIVPKTKLDSRNRWEVRLASSTPLTHGKPNACAKWLRELGVWNRRSHQKVVPDKVFMQPDAGIALFLCHLWSTDGCLHLKKCGTGFTPFAYYASNSQKLARDVQSLLLRLKIQSTLREVDQKGKGLPMWHVIVTGQSDIKTFLERVGAFGERRQRIARQMGELIATQSENTNRDIIPKSVWCDLVIPAMQRNGITSRELAARLNMSYSGTALYKSNLSRARAAKVAAIVGCEKLKALASSDLYFDRIISIEPDGEEETFDLTVDDLHSFVANDIIVHNSIEADADIVMFIYRASYYRRKAMMKDGEVDPNAEPDPDEGVAEVIIGKHRNGPVGAIKLAFQPEYARFGNLVRDYNGGYDD
ncbi:replicative DNA helicase [Abditibacteriota bacterium]|nr:replicative DNA helicase [Abditibacteriota bacterium]